MSFKVGDKVKILTKGSPPMPYGYRKGTIATISRNDVQHILYQYELDDKFFVRASEIEPADVFAAL